MAATTQFGVLQPLERKECPFQFAKFTQRERQAVLPGIGREFAQNHRRCDRPRFNRHGEAQQFEPMIAYDAKIGGTRQSTVAFTFLKGWAKIAVGVDPKG